jgi:hypothetical protein
VEDRRDGQALSVGETGAPELPHGSEGGPHSIYIARLRDRQAAVAALDRTHARLSWVRLGLFGLGAVLLLAIGWTGGSWILPLVVVFIGVAFAHARVLNRLDRARRSVAFYERGLARLEDRWAGTGETGERFRSESHLYADDLDVFGRGSLFELLSTPRTRAGETMLATWLKQPATVSEIQARQPAVAELGPRLDLHEDLAVLGPEVRAAVDTDALLAWAAEPPVLTATWPRVVFALMASVTCGLIGWWIWSGVPPALLGPWLIGQTLLAGLFRHRVNHVAEGVEAREGDLQVLASILARLERETVSSPRLRELMDALRVTGRAPSTEIGRLARLVDMIDSNENPLFRPVAALLLLKSQFAFAVERWRVRSGRAVPRWLEVVGELEALSALATYASEHPADVMPELVEGAPRFEATALAHPLIPSDRAVPNDVALGGDRPHVLLVSGSNMSGKSTLLRTVGLNAVLAQAGAPVRAQKLTMTLLQVGATLRIQDSLQSGRSRFFAEITRLSEIVALARANSHVLFLLDEVLAGTNSHDRQQGAAAIVTGVVELGAIGLITTHDLALTDMVIPLGARAENVHFEDHFENGTLHFDFRLRPGVVRTSNAIALMRSVGLDV